MTHLPIGLLLAAFTIVCLTKLADASHNGTEPTASVRRRFFPVGACGVRARRPEGVVR